MYFYFHKIIDPLTIINNKQSILLSRFLIIQQLYQQLNCLILISSRIKKTKISKVNLSMHTIPIDINLNTSKFKGGLQLLRKIIKDDYQPPSPQNLKNCYIHLTKQQILYQPTKKFCRGGKKCLRTVWEQLVQKNIDVSELRETIQQTIKKYLVGIYPFLKYYYRASFPKNIGKYFHLIDLDILIDNNLKPWLLEANYNPSLRIRNQYMNGFEKVNQKSPVDLYVKRIVLEDTIFLLTLSLQQQTQLQVGDHYFLFKKILDNEEQEMQEFSIIENMVKIFDSQCSVNSNWTLNLTKFTMLANLAGITGNEISKNDYLLIFTRTMKHRYNPRLMPLEMFIEALQYTIKGITGYSQDIHRKTNWKLWKGMWKIWQTDRMILMIIRQLRYD